MTRTALRPRISGALPAGVLLATDTSGATHAPTPRTPAPRTPAPHVATPAPAPLDEAAWQALERMLAERERCRRAHPARGGRR